MKNSLKSFLFRLPAVILLIACFIGSVAIKLSASLNAKYPLSWAPAVVLLIILILYFRGEYINACRESFEVI